VARYRVKAKSVPSGSNSAIDAGFGGTGTASIQLRILCKDLRVAMKREQLTAFVRLATPRINWRPD
jgi:hypothetical protein